jgi:molybdate transport system substrate-binding protein
MLRRSIVSALPLILSSRVRAQTDAVQIYAAMTFRAALEQVIAAYRDAGGAATAIYAPTPVLVRQLAGGAPADILLTADPAWMDEAARQSLVRPDTRSTLMANDLVLAGPAGSHVVGLITPAFELAALLGEGRLAMCDPEHDPAGRYGRQSLQALGFWETAQPRIAIAESAPAAVVLVDKGEARAAVCFRTDLYGDQHALLIGTFPPESHAPIEYSIALAVQSRNARAPEALAFLHTPGALKIFSGFGYRVPD